MLNRRIKVNDVFINSNSLERTYNMYRLPCDGIQYWIVNAKGEG